MKTDFYVAHYNRETDKCQFVSEHCKRVAEIIFQKCSIDLLKPLACLAGLCHDSGKYSDSFVSFMDAIRKDPDHPPANGGDHATAGGRIVEELFQKSVAKQMIQIAIYSHHGLYDCISCQNGESLLERRKNKEIETDKAIQRYWEFFDRTGFQKLIESSNQAFEEIRKGIFHFCKSKSNLGPCDFYLAMFERVLLSLLLDGDRTDTAIFMGNRKETPEVDEKQRTLLWGKCRNSLEQHLTVLGQKGAGQPINQYRQKISDLCLSAAESTCSLYRLTVPTGAGKTLSALRFALRHAEKYKKKKIFYVAPYNSILEQNAKEWRDVLAEEGIVLEHHSNVIHEGRAERIQYELLTENWESPVIATTAVQLLNALFSSRTSDVRRMQSLCNSVLIFDEVQAIPVRCISLFNMAVNFMSEFCNTTVVLCSATQPLFDKLKKNSLLPPENMAGDPAKYTEAFRRTSLIDCTQMNPSGFTIESLCDFILEKMTDQSRILVIVNTKKCAENLYHELKLYSAERFRLYHLSTNMCAANREEKIKEIRKILEESPKKPMICVSTQLIEAGVDLSFDTVVRSLAGLDSIIQAAGRCNRHGEEKNGNVYIVKMSEEAEHVSRIPDIEKGQDAMRSVLYQYQLNPEYFHHNLSSEEAISLYYQYYFFPRFRSGEMNYTVSVEGVNTTLVDLLSTNEKFASGKKLAFKQAFKTAGQKFEVIPEDGKIEIVVEYDENSSKALDVLRSNQSEFEDRKEAVRSLQRYTVGISESMRNRLGNAIQPLWEGRILVLSKGYYSTETGVLEEPENMSFLLIGRE